MSKRDKLIEKLLSRPADFKYDDFKSLLIKFGYREDNRGRTSGSRIAFVNSSTRHIIRLYKPHPEKVRKKYQIDQLIEDLKNQGVIQL